MIANHRRRTSTEYIVLLLDYGVNFTTDTSAYKRLLSHMMSLWFSPFFTTILSNLLISQVNIQNQQAAGL